MDEADATLRALVERRATARRLRDAKTAVVLTEQIALVLDRRCELARAEGGQPTFTR